ncbi:hypothetical protein Dsin_027328 [Dipteronia sinensis]|uniref:Glutathione S-transferase n=1 Tax=Dipteronia sinensis TaxID=43782 RepID=A0AAE0DUG9_9ROSI|nr:hypothetical protein Dsin_027328 [Dipteronia sinensis]
MEEVKLHGNCFSPFSCRVTWALKLKGIPFENIEEDLSNKSPLLLQYNPVNKQIPVLVHVRKPICESMIILEYLEETWPQNPLLPTDPFERAVARFWIKFSEEMGPTMWMMFRSSGEEQEKFKKESLEMLKTIEEMALGDHEKKFFGGDQISLVDIAFGAHAHWLLEVIEKVVGVRLLEAHKFPRLHAWIQNFKQVPVINQNLPDSDQMVLTFKRNRERLLASS